MEGSRSTLSPKLYGNGGPLAIAEATADLRKSMARGGIGRIARKPVSTSWIGQ
jgi:hypothetical protein